MRGSLVRRRGGRRGGVAALVLAGALAGCGTAPVATFDLSAPRPSGGGTAGARGQLLVAEPAALAIFETDKIVVRPAAGAITHLAGAQWGDRLPKLLQARLLQAFENANRIRAVGRPNDRITADFQLVTDVRAFQIVFSGGQPFAEVELSAKIVADRAGRIVAGRIFRARVAAAATEGPAAVEALDQAFGRVASDLVRWAGRVV